MVVGHSLGAFIGLMINDHVDKNIYFDISLHPSDMFKSMENKDGIFRWKNIDEGLLEKFVLSANSLPNIDTLLKNLKTKTYFIGALQAGARISKSYHDTISDMSEYLEFAINHDFKGYEEWVAKTTLKLIYK